MRALGLFLATAVVALAQIDPDTITVVSRAATATAGPDTVNYSVSVNASVGSGLDDVLKALAGLAVTERDLTDVSASRGSIRVCIPGPDGCTFAATWRFQFSSPLAKLTDTLSALARRPPAGISVSYSVSGGSLSPTPECAYPTLISQARRHAESLAAAAGVRVGRITALSDQDGEPTGRSSCHRRI